MEELSFEKLESIASQYLNEEGLNLVQYHRDSFKLSEDMAVSFNKEQRLIIVGQEISKEIKQTSEFLNKKGLEIYCLEFKYFKEKKEDKILTGDFVVSKDKLKGVIKTASKPIINEKIFIDSVDDYIKDFFKALLDFASKNSLPIHWGSTGFSLNVNIDENDINILYAYSKIATGGQSIYTAVQEIRKKVNNIEEAIQSFVSDLYKTGLFVKARNEIKWIINKPIDKEKKDIIFDALLMLKDRIIKKGLLE